MSFPHIEMSLEVSILILALTLVLGPGCGQVAEGEGDLLKMENQRYQAMVQKDLKLLDSVLDDNLIFTHASGKIDSKESFIDSLNSGALVYKKIDIEDTEVRLYDSCGVVTGKSLLDIHVRGEDRKLQLRFTTVWVKDQGVWKVVAYQSTSA
jgi:ketosteroid isomerase-like protein